MSEKQGIRGPSALGVRSPGSGVDGTGPYVVTTKRPDDDDRNCDCLVPYMEGAGNHSPGCACFKPRVVSRRAVATLEEARWSVIGRICRVAFDAGTTDGYQPFEDAARALPESGGMVGPLPDGTVIEVEPRSTDSLIAELAAMGVTHGPAGDVDLAVTAAFNARQA